MVSIPEPDFHHGLLGAVYGRLPVVKRVGRDGRSFASVAVVYPTCRWRASASWPTWIVADRGPIVVLASSARTAIGLVRCRSDRRAMSGSLAQHLAWKAGSGYAASGSAHGTSLCQTAQTSRPCQDGIEHVTKPGGLRNLHRVCSRLKCPSQCCHTARISTAQTACWGLAPLRGP